MSFFLRLLKNQSLITLLHLVSRLREQVVYRFTGYYNRCSNDFKRVNCNEVISVSVNDSDNDDTVLLADTAVCPDSNNAIKNTHILHVQSSSEKWCCEEVCQYRSKPKTRVVGFVRNIIQILSRT